MSTQAERPSDIGFARPRPVRHESDEPFRQSLADLSRQLAGRGPFQPPPELDPRVADRLPPEPSEPARQMRRHRAWLAVLALAVGFGIAAIIRAIPGPPADSAPAQRPVATVAPPPATPAPATPAPAPTAAELPSPQPTKLDPPAPPPPAAPTPAAPVIVAVPEPAVAAPPPPSLSPSKARLEGYEIMEVQTRLKAIGLNPGPLDGIVGGQTAGAIKDYEASRGKPRTGRADGALLQQLREETGRK